MKANGSSAARRCWIGIVLLAIVCPLRADDYSELLAKALESRAHAVRAGRKPAPVKQPAAAHEPTEADKRLGVVVWAPPMGQMFVDRMPAASEVPNAISVRAARGEIESFLLAVGALKPQLGLTWSAPGPVPDGIAVEFMPVVMAPLPEGKDEYRMVGLWLAGGGQVDIDAARSRAWLVRISVGQNVKPGNYTITASLASRGRAATAGATVRIRVLPFQLADPWRRQYVFGAFCASPDLSDAQFAQLKAHGIEGILWFWVNYGLNVRNDRGKLRMDFAKMDATIGRMKKAKMRGPIVLALGNDRSGHFGKAICQTFKLPMQPRVKREGKIVKLAPLDDPRVERLMVEALRQLFDHAKAAQWPEIVIAPYDEPAERLMPEHRRMVRLFRKNFPTVRLYGVAINKVSHATQVLDTDIIVANGDYAGISALAAANRKSLWLYGGGGAAAAGYSTRWGYGLKQYAFGPDGAWFWSYNFYVGDPWNEFDSFTPDSSWVACWPPLTKGATSVQTLAYEGLREGVDDVRYAMTLEAALARAPADPNARTIAAAYKKWLVALRDAKPAEPQIAGFRDQLVHWILAVDAATAAPLKRSE